MVRPYKVAIIAAIMIAFVIFYHIYITGTFSSFEEALSPIDSLLQDEKYDEILHISNTVYYDYKSAEKLLYSLLDHSSLEPLNENFQGLISGAKLQDSVEISKYAMLLENNIAHLVDTNAVSIENIL